MTQVDDLRRANRDLLEALDVDDRHLAALRAAADQALMGLREKGCSDMEAALLTQSVIVQHFLANPAFVQWKLTRLLLEPGRAAQVPLEITIANAILFEAFDHAR